MMIGEVGSIGVRVGIGMCSFFFLLVFVALCCVRLSYLPLSGL